MARLPDIPSIGTSEASVGVRRVFDAIRRAFAEINKSGGVETGSSIIDRIEQAVSSATSGSSSTHTPPKPVNVVATGEFAHIMVSWDDPYFIHLAYAEIWRSTGTEIADATRVGTTNATMFSDFPPSQSISVSYNYWVRFVSNDDTPQYGPWSDMVTASTADDPAYVLEILAGEIEATQLHADLTSRINLIDTDTTSPLSVAKRLADEASARGAAITAEQTARQTADSSLSSSLTALTASVNSNTTAISTEQTTRANADSAEVTARQALATKVTGFADPTGKALANLTSGLIYEEKTIRSSETSSIASSVSTLTTTVNGHTSTIQTHTSSINGLYAQYTVKLDVNGKVSGFGLASTSNSSLFEIVADRFAICNTSGSGKKYPFVVDSTYGVVMDSALIKDGTITNAKIASLAADKLYASSGTIASAIIGSGHISNAMIGSYISSTNYNGSTSDPYNSPGSAGWCIAKGGGAAFNNVLVRGSIEATSVAANSITTNHLVNHAATSMAYGWTPAAGPHTLTSGTTYALTQCSISVYGGLPVVIEAEYCAEASTSSPDISMVIGITKGNTSSLLISRNDPLLIIYAGAQVYTLNGTRSIRFVDVPASSGTCTYYLTLQVNGSVTTKKGIYNKYIRATEYRR